MAWQEEMGQHARQRQGRPLQPSQAAEDRLAGHAGSQEPDPEMVTNFLKICSSGDFYVCLALPMMLPVGCSCLGTWMGWGAGGNTVPTH